MSQCELLAIDEAAAIPLPIVKGLLGPYLVFLSSTIHGYEGTGRALTLKLIQQLRSQRGAEVKAAAIHAGASVAGSNTKKGARQLHEERWKVAAETAAASSKGGGGSTGGGARTLTEITLDCPIRYGAGDAVERWMNGLLCLDVTAHSTRMVGVLPAPRDCSLYMVNRDALFSYHSLSEGLLQRIWALYTSAHYKNSPNDLQMLSDAPAHRLFVLLGPQTPSSSSSSSSSSSTSKGGGGLGLPEVLCVIQVAFEGLISQKSVQSEISRGNKASGDLIPWTISQQFSDSEFPSLSGARVVRIATHPDVQKMGYGSRAVDLLTAYFQGELSAGAGPSPPMGSFGGEGAEQSSSSSSSSSFTSVSMGGGGGSEEEEGDTDGGGSLLTEQSLKPRAKLPPLLTPLIDRPAERLHWIGSSFGLTSPLLNFWSRKGFRVCYLRQTRNELTGEFSCIALKELRRAPEEDEDEDDDEGGGGGRKSKAKGKAKAGRSSSSGFGTSGSGPAQGWLEAYMRDYRRRLVSLLGFSFQTLEAPLAITLIDPERLFTAPSSSSSSSSSSSGDAEGGGDLHEMEGDTLASEPEGLYGAIALGAAELLSVHLSSHDMKRLELYARNMVDHHLVLDTLGVISRLLFFGRLKGLRLSSLQIAILLATGLQNRDVDSVSKELDLPVNQVLAFFNKTVRKIVACLRNLLEAQAAKELPSSSAVARMEGRAGAMNALPETLDADQRRDESEFVKKKRELLMGSKDLSKHSITAKVDDLANALGKGLKKQQGNVPSSISVPTTKLAPPTDAELADNGDDEEDASKREISSSNIDHKKKKRKSLGGAGNSGHTIESNSVGSELASEEKKKKKKQKHKTEEH